MYGIWTLSFVVTRIFFDGVCHFYESGGFFNMWIF